jgi:pimeloyl-ACP methyl ester carboxylesterase
LPEEKAEEHERIRAPDGVEIRYEVAEQGEQALVFIHGWSRDHSYWRIQMDRFALSHRLVAIDLGGRGEPDSGRTDWTKAAFRQMEIDWFR